VAGPFLLYTDEDVHGHLIKALRQQGWDIVRAVDVFPQGTDDEARFEYATKENRVLVSNDQPALEVANRWLSEGRRFRLITWDREHYQKMSIGDLLRKFEALMEQDEPFDPDYPIIHL